MDFKLQMPTSIIRDNTFKSLHFVVYLKLIQLYYLNNKNDMLEFDHKQVMYHLNIGENRVFKSALNELYNRGFILTDVSQLPRNKPLHIKLNSNVLPEHNRDNRFTQLPFQLIHKDILQLIGYVGVRLIYYYSSYINYTDTSRLFCFTSILTITRETGISKRTIIDYNKTLCKLKFLKIDKHILSHENSYITVKDKEILNFTKYNNHYFINERKIIEYLEKKNKKAQN